ncbi:MAG: hypothetical protein E6Z52_13655, partial [Staphylococcus sp.]|nr:hypothetical protein [Staphylococcus sp.]
NIENAVKESDLVIGAVLIPGAKAPSLVTEDMIKQMKDGSVIVDIAIDQGGIFETTDKITTHDDPTYVKHGVVHYAVANMPGAVPRTSTIALTISFTAFSIFNGLDIIVFTRPSNKSSNSANRLGFTSKIVTLAPKPSAILAAFVPA